MEPLTGQTLGDVLCTRATGNWAAPFCKRAQAALGASFNSYINAYGAGGQFYLTQDPAPGLPTAKPSKTKTGLFIYAWPVALGIGGMSDADFKARIPELTAACQGSPQLPA